LKSPDFFDIREYPTATFTSTAISAAEADAKQITINGDLTLHGVTKPISFPATVDIDNDTLTLRSEFSINRMDFGITFGPEQVENKVTLTVVVGEPTSEPVAAPGPTGGTRGPGPGGYGGRAFDPAEAFKRWDADGDGKLAGDEIQDRMRENLTEIDKDGDGAVTLEEFQERMRQFRPGGGRPGGETPPPTP
jgi:hypothetical protein